jgi:hypothetical protein
MSSALLMRDRVLTNELKGLSKEKLLKLKNEAIEREHNRINNTDWDDCFVSSQIDRTKIATINQLLDTRVEKDFTNTILEIDGYTITILESNKFHYNIVNKELKLNVDYYACGYGNITGKGARKYIDELENINKKVKNYMKINRYM